MAAFLSRARRRTGPAFFRTLKTCLSPKNIFTREDRRLHLRGWEIAGVILGSVLVAGLMDWIGRFDLSRPVLAMTGSVFVAIRLRWRMRRFPWFWATIAIYLLIAAILTASLSWSTEGPSRGIIGGFMAISVYCLFVALHAIELHIEKHKARSAPGGD